MDERIEAPISTELTGHTIREKNTCSSSQNSSGWVLIISTRQIRDR